MVNIHPSLEMVHAVVEPIPDPQHRGRNLAEPGDELILRPSDPDFPIVIRRTLPMELAAVIPHNALRLLHVEPIARPATRPWISIDGGAPVSLERRRPGAVREPRKLPRAV